MRKKTKIILIVISSIILLIGVLLFLIFKTNLFLDTGDLVCSFTYAGGEDQKIYDIKIKMLLFPYFIRVFIFLGTILGTYNSINYLINQQFCFEH